MLEMLPQAFSKNRRSFAYLAPQDGVLVVDAGSAKQAEDLASTLRKSLGSLPLRPPAVEQAPSHIACTAHSFFCHGARA